ncbi:serine/threonine protein kinase [Sulfitobacter sp. M57]|uniref:serine/threonine protein kinase n=1 Tax=unclassified Sulfitobacter TaxID=196795 RepID=UPI0023E2983A|nr:MULTISPECIES: serine/threonine protein kinase [unclassified Sulfitobacter]MDF3416147.1 serine/threonine protein kinase [Sulfitobacter sp. KE5]MDF3423626.1 serine/threonine protein kinase [Sulfitobacter sp. KE43]MDF3434572.1 serine/threonine protein kinase [Sulfitobacter sp. KE42]MDF3460332.1 serine/threonine protein kinase [Sulfitobacter sp. S74]MDF3464110.1 serine/threonine protein kinase [Sulfitobacter sp. Ks18]
MSFLPYSGAGPGGWWAATAGAVVLHGAAIAIGFGGLQNILAVAAPDPEDRPEYTITIAPLDSDTIAGLLEQEGEAGADDGNGIDPATPETIDDADPEELAALAPEETVPAEPVAPEPVEPEPVAQEPEKPATLEPEIPEALEAVPAAPLEAEPETVQPVSPATTEPLDTGPLIPETVTALPSAPALSPVVPEGTAGLITTPVPSAGEAITRVRPEAEVIRPAAATGTVVAAVGRRPDTTPPTPRPAAPAPSAQDIAVGDLLRRIKTAVTDPCLLALPRRDGTEGVGLALIASSDAAMARFSDAVLNEADSEIRQTRVLIDDRQCGALNYVRLNRDYPATQLGLRLDAAEVPSGGNLTGVLRGTAGRYVTLLLVDNNGVVQDLQRFMSFSGNFARFDVPVTRPGAPRDTKQILLAIATRRPSTDIKNRAGQLAQDVFSNLSGEIASQAALAVATFDVR